VISISLESKPAAHDEPPAFFALRRLSSHPAPLGSRSDFETKCATASVPAEMMKSRDGE